LVIKAIHRESGDLQDAVNIAVIGQYIAARRRVLGHGLRISQQHAGVVDRVDANTNRGRHAAAVAIADGDYKAVAAAVIGIRDIGVAAINIQSERAMDGRAAQAVIECVAVDVIGDDLPADGRVFRRIQ